MIQTLSESKQSNTVVRSILDRAATHQPTGKVIKQVFEGTALSIGHDFFTSLARNLSHALDIPYVILTRLGDDGKLHGLAFWNEGEFSELDCYDPNIAPCGETLKEGSYFCPYNVQKLFPKDRDLVALNAQSYYGVALKNSREEVIGNLYVVDRRTMSDPALYEGVLNLFAMRAAAELEREQYLQQIQELNDLNAHLYEQEQIKSAHLAKTLHKLEQTQVQLVHTEKIAALGQLVAGVAHEVNNPVSCISGNLECSQECVQSLLEILALYQAQLPNPDATLQEKIEEADLAFISKDLPNMLTSMKEGVFRVKDIMQSLRSYSRNDGHKRQTVDIHKGLETTLMILKHKMKANSCRPEIQIKKQYGKLPDISCFPGQLNQVFMNIIANAIDAFEDINRFRHYREIEANPNVIEIRTMNLEEQNSIQIVIADNGPGIPKEVRQRIFNSFFTTKPEGKGTGLGLSISWDIVTELHRGKIECCSEMGQGTQFILILPLNGIN